MLGIFEAGSHSVGQPGLELMIFLPVLGLQYVPLHLDLENSSDEQESWTWPQKAGGWCALATPQYCGRST